MNDPTPRRALSSMGGPITTWGDSGFFALLEAAWASTASDPDRLTHGFHTYPARMHPGIAAHLIEALSGPADTVVDPFCGGGTVLVEAMVTGRRSYGIDLNPLAARLSRVRTQRRDPASRARFSATLARVVEASLERVAAKAPSRAPLPPPERRFYAPNVLRELAGLYEEIATVELAADRQALQMLLSAIVVKFSQQRADTSDRPNARRIGKRIPTQFFGRKGEELVSRWQQVDEACGRDPTRRCHRPKVMEGDMRLAADLLPNKGRARAIISSPPYGGTYDYVEHHARRYPWLGLSPAKMRQDELGARRDMAGREASRTWNTQVRQMLRSMAAILQPGGIVALVVGDAEVGGQRMDAARQLGAIAPSAGLRLVASAAQPRVDWRGGAPRREHIVLLRPDVEA